MRGLGAIYRRELAGLFFAPLAWILLCLALFYNTFFFLHYLESQTGGEVDAALTLVSGGAWPFWILIVFLPPLLTMRMISEESRSGMLTAPVGDAAVVAGKALAGTTFLALVWSCVPVYGLAVQLLGAPPDWGIVLTAWLGAVLVSALFVAIGLVSSALSGTPLVAAFMATVALVLIVFLPVLLQGAAVSSDGVLAWVLERVDVMAHLQASFLSGALDSGHVVFFAAWILAGTR